MLLRRFGNVLIHDNSISFTTGKLQIMSLRGSADGRAQLNLFRPELT